ncbi:MAG: response regulator [Bacteroides sp.]|nr:response regulator [Bacteroides sp.]
MKIIQTLLVLLGGLFPFILNAGTTEDIYFSHIGMEDGLSHSTIFAINQDKEGNLWFATYDGVNKYDGYNFTVYRHEYANPNSIASDITRCIAIDDSDQIWVGTREGLSFYNRRKNSFSNYYYKKNGINVPINSIAPIKENWLMLGTAEGILLFDIKKECFINDTLPSLHLLKPTVLVRQGEYIYIGAEDGVYTYTLSGGKLERLVSMPAGIRIHAILCQMFSRIWMATEGDGLFMYDAKTKELKNYRYESEQSGLNSNYVRSLELDTENRLWVGTYSGLNIYKEATDNFSSIKSSEIQEGSLSQNSVRSIFKDSQGGMWLGTYWGGLNYYHPLCNRFQRIKHVPFLNSLSNNVVSCIVEDSEHNLWIGTSDGGLNFYDSTSKLYKNYLFKSGSLDVPFKDIKTVYVDEEHDKVYVGAHAGGMMALQRKSGRVEYFNRQNSNLPSNNIYSIISDENGGLWVASLEHLLHFDIDKRNFTIVDKDQNGRKLQQYNRLLFRDSRRRIWVGGEMGVSVYNQIGTDFLANTDFHIDPILQQAFVNCFYESTSGYIWIGTRSGLFAMKEGSKELLQYTTADGLPSNVIYGIMEDAYARLWISTNQGLSCLNPENGKFRNFTILDGLQGNQFNAGSYCRQDNGYMLFGGVNGITLFRPETLIDNPYAPKPVINKLFVYNKEVLPNDETGILSETIEYADHITLSSSQNSFAISFVVSNYIAGKHNTFAYKLEGYNDEWYRQNDTSPVSYSNLPAGDYTFYIKAANNDGKWNEEPTVLHIRVLPVWYCTWWALSLFALSFMLVVFGIVRYFWLRKSMQAEILMERLDKEKQEEISQMKIRFYVNISHELRTPLTLIVAPLQELLSRISGHWEHEQLLYIQRNTNRLLHLVNQLMDYRRAELGIFKLRLVSANAYKRVLNSFMNYESLSKKKDIDYNFYTELQDKELLFDENYLDLIVNNLLSNAFKYTEEGESITVKLYQEAGDLVLQVTDTGIGIPKEKQEKIFERFYQVESGREGSGIGLSLVQRLVELHHGRIELESEPGKGSTFSIYLPQDKSVYSREELLGGEENADNQRVYSTNAHDVYIGDEEEADTESEEDENTNKRGTLLVVEDNKELRQYLVNGLSGLFNMLEAENGQKALDILKEKEVDLIVTDVMMPVMDGAKLCKLVKQNLRTCHIPIYMLSAKADIKYQLEGLQVGADDYIAKPFSMAILKAKIMNMLRTRHRIFEHYSNTTEIEPEKLTNNTMDEELLRKAIAVIERNMDNVEFSTEQFAREMNMSRSNLHLKLKAITGKSAIDFIHKIRFNRACQLLQEGKYNVSEISFMVGYNTPSYFAARFKKYIGCLPTEYGKK